MSLSDSQTSLFRRLLQMSLPVMGLNVLAVLSMVVDTAMCGRLDDANVALAGLGFASQLVFLLAVGMMGLNVGAIALVSRAFGGGEHERVNHVLAQATTLTVLVGLLVAVVGNLAASSLIQLLGGEGASLEAGLDYLRVILLGSPAYYSMILLAGILRGVGETRTAFFAALVSNLINVALNYCLILGNLGFPALGVQGAAIGTVLSQVINAGILIAAMRGGVVEGLTFRWPSLRVDRGLVSDLFRIGWPAATDMIVLNASFLSIVGMLGRITPDAVAAHGIGLRLQALAFVPGLGVSQATAALVGQALGAGAVSRARETLRASVVLCTSIMSTLGIVILVAAYPIVWAFDVSSATPLEAYAVEWIRILGWSMPLYAIHIAFTGLLQGSGSTRIALSINIVATFLVQVPLSAILAFPVGLGATGAWLGFAAAGLVKVVMVISAYRSDRWAIVGTRR